MTLADVKRGSKFNIVNIPDERTRAQALRFGICEGTCLSCGEKIPGGPIVIKKNLQEIAIGRRLAEQIVIEEVS